MAEFKIQNRIIGDNYSPVVIAEIGINHEGSLETAIKIADAAINSGAEIIKHQTHIIEDEMSDEAKLVIPSHTKDSIYDIMKRCALSEDDEKKSLFTPVFLASERIFFIPSILVSSVGPLKELGKPISFFVVFEVSKEFLSEFKI